MNVDDYQYETLRPIAKRWKTCWTIAAHTFHELSTTDRLDEAMAIFLRTELDIADPDQHPRMVTMLAVSGAILADTHTQMAIRASVARLASGKHVSFIDRANTKLKRLLLFVMPFLLVIDGFLFMRGYDRSDGLGLTFVVMVLMTIACPIAAFTRVLDWMFER